jgi:hypothetical protein
LPDASSPGLFRDDEEEGDGVGWLWRGGGRTKPERSTIVVDAVAAAAVGDVREAAVVTAMRRALLLAMDGDGMAAAVVAVGSSAASPCFPDAARLS